MAVPVVIFGAGGFGRHVLAILRTGKFREQYDFLGFIDDGEVNMDRLQKISAPLRGTSADLSQLPEGTHYVIGIGNGRVRKLLDTRCREAGLHPLTVIHPDTSIAADVEIGAGSVICAGVRITTNVVLGEQVHLNMNVTVGHDVVLKDRTTVFPLVALGGESVIGSDSVIGAASVINPNIQVGNGAYIAANAAVTKDVPAQGLMAGVPAVFKKSLAR